MKTVLVTGANGQLGSSIHARISQYPGYNFLFTDIDTLDICDKKNNIPRTFNRGKTYWSKKHIDAYFAKKAPNPDITEWYSSQEMQEKFGMTLSAIYCFVSKNAIPKKKEGIMVYYSKKHVDIAKGIAIPEEPQYYTVAEAMEKFNLTRDQLYHYATYHKIPKVKKGKYTLISKAELDKLLAAPKIE